MKPTDEALKEIKFDVENALDECWILFANMDSVKYNIVIKTRDGEEYEVNGEMDDG